MLFTLMIFSIFFMIFTFITHSNFFLMFFIFFCIAVKYCKLWSHKIHFILKYELIGIQFR